MDMIEDSEMLDFNNLKRTKFHFGNGYVANHIVRYDNSPLRAFLLEQFRNSERFSKLNTGDFVMAFEPYNDFIMLSVVDGFSEHQKKVVIDTSYVHESTVIRISEGEYVFLKEIGMC